VALGVRMVTGLRPAVVGCRRRWETSDRRSGNRAIWENKEKAGVGRKEGWPDAHKVKGFIRHGELSEGHLEEITALDVYLAP